ncbi:MAG: hypothetical protein CVU38_03950 [Chloroflexi bacterium HGW-Chloroflexi-1]|nr:MAG: hypothetical protein CVU38_03950 [Chloroflexi bacterium HGW-Chloroflexi-1]
MVVLAISLDTQENKVARLVQKKGWTFTVLLDSQVEVACRYGASGIPRTLVIDREGVVRHVEDGYSPGTRELLAQTIEEALK